MALDAKTAELAAKSKLNEKAIEWLITKDILTFADVALLAANEEQVDKPNTLSIPWWARASTK